jgi:hypothetical protein
MNIRRRNAAHDDVLATARHQIIGQLLPHVRLVVLGHLLVSIKRHCVRLGTSCIGKSQNAIVAKEIERLFLERLRFDAVCSVAQPIRLDTLVHQTNAQRIVVDFNGQLAKRNVRYKDIPLARQARDGSRVSRPRQDQHRFKHVLECPSRHETRLGSWCETHPTVL